MPSALDAAAYILAKHGPMTTMKLQKLVYYSQAWSIVWDDEELFPEEIEAWRNGPVARELYNAHRGSYRVDEIPGGTAGKITGESAETVDIVLQFYGDKSAQWLSDLTHMEDPWKDAWAEGPNTVISKEAMAEYYSSIGSLGEQEA